MPANEILAAADFLNNLSPRLDMLSLRAARFDLPATSRAENHGTGYPYRPHLL